MFTPRLHPRTSLLALAVFLPVAAASPARADPKAAPAYEVDTAASRIYVKVGSATRLGHPHGVEGGLKSGKLIPGGGGELVFDMDSFKADTGEARRRAGLGDKKVSESEVKKVNDTMRGAAVLGVAEYPTATFRVTSVAPLDKQAAGEPGAYQLEGAFTLHGTEKPLQVKAKLERTDRAGVLKMTGTFTVRQTDYGMKPYSAAGGLVKVADELEITGELVLRPAGK